jgi:hypothetical protein
MRNYFLRMVKVRNAQNLIKHLWDENGKKVEDVEEIKQLEGGYYKKLLWIWTRNCKF